MKTKDASPAAANTVPPPSRRMLALFHAYLRWYLPRGFHAVRVAHAERFPRLQPNSRTIVCFNHPSWWDPLIVMLLLHRFAPRIHHYGPMEASALRHYGFMRKLGLFPLDTRSALAGAQFLRIGNELLQRPGSILCVTPEGTFMDVRHRPTEWRPGLAALVARQAQCTVIPIALEYTFWDERLPEALALIGEPLRIESGVAENNSHWHGVLTGAMTRAQDELAVLGIARSAAPFTTVLQGGSGIAGIYNLWKRAQARWRGQPYSAEHGSLPPA